MNLFLRQLTALVLPCLISLSSSAPLLAAEVETDSALTQSVDQIEAMAAYQTQLENLESQFGPYDSSLLEPLQSMTRLAEEQQDFQRVAELQTRQLQVMRTMLGFRNPELIPLLHDIIRNEIRLQSWEAISDHLEHIRFLTAANSADSSPEHTQALLRVMEQQAYWHLTRVYLDREERRVRNFMEARSLYEEVVDLAQEKFGEDSPELIPWMYKFAISEYRLVELLNSKHGLSSATIDRLVQEDGVARLQFHSGNRSFLLGDALRIPVVEQGDLVGEAYLRDGMQMIGRIVDIVEAQGNLEAQAMAEIYYGDFQKLMGMGTAMGKYRDAREKLLQAGIAEGKIEQYFNQPSIIPVSELFLSLDAALAHREKGLQGIEDHDPRLPHLGQFIAWDEALPDVPQPNIEDGLFTLDLSYNRVELTASISSSGDISTVKVISAFPEERSVEREAYRAVREIQVRPAIIDGRARRLRNVPIRYLFLAED